MSFLKYSDRYGYEENIDSQDVNKIYKHLNLKALEKNRLKYEV